MKILGTLFFILILIGQDKKLSIYEMNQFHKYGYFQDEVKNEVRFTSPPKVMLASFLIPGLGQYLNDDDIKALVFVGIEVLSWSIYSSNNSKGDKRTKVFENVANTDFSRIKYYRALAEDPDVNLGNEFSNLGLTNFGDEERDYQILKNSNLWNTLRDAENNSLASDKVHMLPDTKTQQYYEMIGKYAQFFVGWKNLDQGISEFEGDEGTFTFTDFSDWRKFKLYPRPEFISGYYDIRNSANDFYKKADWAIRGVFINHLISGIEALISSKRRLKTRYSSKYYNGELVPTLTLKYQF